MKRNGTPVFRLFGALLVVLGTVTLNANCSGIFDGSGSDDDGFVRDNNIFGIHTLLYGGDDIDKHLDMARYLVGSGGYVTQPFGPVTQDTTRPQSFWVEFVRGVYNRGMIPIVRLNTPYSDQGYYAIPPTNDGGDPTGPSSYSQVAQAFKDVIAGLPRKAEQPLYVQILNEVNLKYEWGNQTPDPTAYAYFLKAVLDAVEEIGDDRIRILNAGLSPQSTTTSHLGMAHTEYVEQMLTAVPELGTSFPVWSVHTYPGPTPPNQNNHDGTAPINTRLTIDAYLFELQQFQQAGFDKPDVLITETAYQLGNGGLTRSQQEDYIVRAFRDYWSAWPEVRGVTPFILLSDQTRQWASFEWVESTTAIDEQTGAPTEPLPHYTAVAQLDKMPARTFPELSGTQDVNMIAVSDSLFFGVEATVSSSIDLYGWNRDYINDGDIGGLGWTSDGSNQDEWIIFDMGTTESVDTVVLHPRGGDAEAGKFFPVSFRIDVSEDGTAWTEVFSHNFAVTDEETWRVNDAFTCDLPDGTSTRYLRLYVTEKTNHDPTDDPDSGYHVQFSEVEAFAP